MELAAGERGELCIRGPQVMLGYWHLPEETEQARPETQNAPGERLLGSGDVRRVGKRWSTESPPSELTAAMDRLQARTSNVRIVRERARAG